MTPVNKRNRANQNSFTRCNTLSLLVNKVFEVSHFSSKIYILLWTAVSPRSQVLSMLFLLIWLAFTMDAFVPMYRDCTVYENIFNINFYLLISEWSTAWKMIIKKNSLPSKKLVWPKLDEQKSVPSETKHIKMVAKWCIGLCEIRLAS